MEIRSKVSLKSTATLCLLVLSSCAHQKLSSQGTPDLHLEGENRLRNIRQMTLGGVSTHGRWSWDGRWLTYQHKNFGDQPPSCDQINRLSVDGKNNQAVSNGLGLAISPFYFPDNSRIIYSSTSASSAACPELTQPIQDKSFWPLLQTLKLYSSQSDGSDAIPLEPGGPRAYTSDATVCKDGSVVFASDRQGDVDLYTAKLDPMGTIHDIHRITHELGYDGEAFFSPDCKQITWSASRPNTRKKMREYRRLLKKHWINPERLEIWVANVDGSHAHAVTRLSAESLAPSFTPDGQRIIFASNYRGLANSAHPEEKTFSLYLINIDGTGLERVTGLKTSESFPMFSPEGKHLVFSSNRNANGPFETNLFIADWVDWPQRVKPSSH